MTEKNQKKPEISKRKRGRPRKINKSITISWRCPYELYQLLDHERKKQEIMAGRKVPMSKVIERFVKKCLY